MYFLPGMRSIPATFLATAAAAVLVANLLGCSRQPQAPTSTADTTAATAATEPSTTEVRAIAKDAYVYGFPLVDSYRIQYAYYVDRNNPEYKGAWNQVHNTARVYTPQDKAIQTPNSDTPYSSVGYDVRAEPLVITVPRMDQDRYYSLQFIDLYTHNFAYVGTRTSGNDGTTVLLTGPGWKGAKPEGIDRIIPSETYLGSILYRTQLFGPDDLENVKRVQAGYKVQPLSAFLGQPPPPAAPAIDFMEPLTAQEERTSPRFYELLNFVLRYAPTVPSETALMARFGKLGIGPDGTFSAAQFSPQIQQAIQDGMADAWRDNEALLRRVHSGEVSTGELFGTREFLKNNYLYRMVGASAGIYGNSREEAFYPSLATDADGQPLDGSHAYTLRFAPGQLPPAKAFWSVTMYEMPASLLVDNPIDRYLINSPMLPSLKKDVDGGITIYIQNESPDKERASNWLPAPKGPFVMAMRIYLPEPQALDGTWKAPTVQKVQ